MIILPALWEWARLFHITGVAQIGYLGFSALMMYAVASTGQMPGAGMQVLSLLMWLVVAPLWLWRRWKLVDRNQAAMLGWLLLMPAWFALLAWRPGPEQGPALLAVMALVWIADTAAYLPAAPWQTQTRPGHQPRQKLGRCSRRHAGHRNLYTVGGSQRRV